MGTTPFPTAAARACQFPACEAEVATDATMCEGHRRVAVSQTGSWLEAG